MKELHAAYSMIVTNLFALERKKEREREILAVTLLLVFINQFSDLLVIYLLFAVLNVGQVEKMKRSRGKYDKYCQHLESTITYFKQPTLIYPCNTGQAPYQQRSFSEPNLFECRLNNT